jgi:hypothetical protein
MSKFDFFEFKNLKMMELLDDVDDGLLAIWEMETVPRGPCLWRKRWDSDYLVNLAITVKEPL